MKITKSAGYRIAAVFILVFLLFSCKSAKLSDAVAKHELGEYYDAGKIYRRVYGKISSKDPVLRGVVAFKMAECLRSTNNTQQAYNAYVNAIRFEYKDSMSHLYAAQMAHKLGKYPEAAKRYQDFLTIDSTNLLAINGLIGCDSAPIWKKNPTRYIVKRMDLMNSRQGEFSPALTGDKYDQMYITSSRKEATGKDLSPITGNKNNDFFLIKQNEKGEWLKPIPIEDELNTEDDEGACSLTSDGSSMYYTFCTRDATSPRSADVYKSARSGAQWNKGQRVEIFKDTLTMAAHPAISPSGKYLYFVSDVKGGYGGKDIWRIEVSNIGVGYPQNLGPSINTPGDEMFPYVRNDSTLYFASNGHPGMGGLDIFKATLQPDDSWIVENMKAPVNSMADDFGITFRGNEESGYFSSNRDDLKGSDHIFSFELPGFKYIVEGWVADRDDEIIPDAIVRIVGTDGTNEKIQARKDGAYRMDVKTGVDYVMKASAPGFLNQKQKLSTPIEEKNEIFYVDFSLASVSKPVVIENVFYDFNKATLRDESKEALDELIDMLIENPNVTIELSAHTDRVGSDDYNNVLSQQRAQSVVDYLIKGGIDKERLNPKGYGKTQPKSITPTISKKYEFLADGQILNETFVLSLPPEQREIADQINRRTEFKVLQTNYRLF